MCCVMPMRNRINATYRLQFRPDFDLDDAAQLVKDLHRLGVSHIYASPLTQAAPGSTHGYDVVNYEQVNLDLGGTEAFQRLGETLKQAGMGLILDMVPNHMAIHPSNPWWWSVLENGPSSRYASYFDVEWDPPEARHSDAVLLPVLGDHYGRVLEAGEIKLAFEEDNFLVRYYDNVYPVDPHTLEGILSAAAELVRDDHLMFLAGAFGRLPTSQATDRASAGRRYRDKLVLRGLLGRLVRDHSRVGPAIQEILDHINQDPDALDVLLRRQNYRLALWKISASELGYRRFFDINSMIGLRMEDESVFQDTHAQILAWLEEGALDGLRIDHPDGLRDPEEYFKRLRDAAPQAWIVVEKILEAEEQLPDAWPVDGTTGYDFMNRLNGVFVDPRAEEPLTRLYKKLTGRQVDYPTLVREKKLMAAQYVLGSDLARLTELFLHICERHRRYRDYSREDLRAALSETAASLPVYRTYICADSSRRAAAGGEELAVSEVDAAYIDEAVEAAKANRLDLDPRLFDFLCDILMLRVKGPLEAELVERFQQFTGPVMAKGVEDTTFYLYNRFISLNEVGGNPSKFGWRVEEFHDACEVTQARWPNAMLSTSTHDTKRSEDVRARLNVISEMPGAWGEAVQRWFALTEPYRSPAGPDLDPLTHEPVNPGGRWPDRNTEYLFYQNLVGAWPLDEERALEYMKKAVREAKESTSWTAPNQAYEQALETFVRGALADRRFMADVETFVGQVLAAGRINSLAQALVKLTAPGIPDIYQGSELWNLALVDPDNRRPVDYELRGRLLDELERENIRPEAVWARVEEGLPKLWLTRQALHLRARLPDLFGPDGRYIPLAVIDPLASAGAQPPAAKAPAALEPDALVTADRETGDERLSTQAQERIRAAETPVVVAVTGQAALPDGSPTGRAAGEETYEVNAGADPGPAALAYLRAGPAENGPAAAVIVPRLVTVFRDRWPEITVALPGGTWHNLLTGEDITVPAPGGQAALSGLFARFPAALLERSGS